MVDIDSHRTIDMIDSRNPDDVSIWLKSYPNIEIISRDGASTYSNAISDYNENVIQISDRFHLIKNLTDYCKEYLYQYLKENNKLNIIRKESCLETNIKETIKTKYYKATELIKNGNLISKACKKVSIDIRIFRKINSLSIEEKEKYFMTNLELKILGKENEKQKLIDEVRRLYKERHSKSKIALILDLDWRTVDKYLKPTTGAKHHRTGEKFGSVIDNYKDEIDILFRKNYKSREIYQIVTNKGYEGSYSTLRHYLSGLKKDIERSKQVNNNYVVIKRKKLIQLLYKPLNKIEDLEREKLKAVYKIYPNFKKIIELIKEFKSILKNSRENYLVSWINKVSRLNIKELNSYINGINRDITAVKNAIKYKYNNGLAEGSVNKTKLVKRIMYGRSSFETLKTKVLRLEFYNNFN